jgi:hypothetical protein
VPSWRCGHRDIELDAFSFGHLLTSEVSGKLTAFQQDREPGFKGN